VFRGLILSTAVILAVSATARGDFIIEVSQEGHRVHATGYGHLNTTALGSPKTVDKVEPAVDPSMGLVNIGPARNVDIYFLSLAPVRFGTGSSTLAHSSGGREPVGIGGFLHVNPETTLPGLIVPHGYVSGRPLFARATWDDTTIEELGMAPGVYTWTWGSGKNEDHLILVVRRHH
jgi:hypothetical protein